MQYMRPLIKKVWPAKYGLRPKTWSNLRSNFRAAVKQVLPPLPRQIDPEWEKLRSRLPDQRMKAGLSRFIGYCERENVPPAAVCDTVIARFLAELETDTLVPSPRDCHRRTCQLWNEAVGKVPGVTAENHVKRYCITGIHQFVGEFHRISSRIYRSDYILWLNARDDLSKDSNVWKFNCHFVVFDVSGVNWGIAGVS